MRRVAKGEFQLAGESLGRCICAHKTRKRRQERLRHHNRINVIQLAGLTAHLRKSQLHIAGAHIILGESNCVVKVQYKMPPTGRNENNVTGPLHYIKRSLVRQKIGINFTVPTGRGGRLHSSVNVAAVDHDTRGGVPWGIHGPTFAAAQKTVPCARADRIYMPRGTTPSRSHNQPSVRRAHAA